LPVVEVLETSVVGAVRTDAPGAREGSSVDPSGATDTSTMRTEMASDALGHLLVSTEDTAGPAALVAQNCAPGWIDTCSKVKCMARKGRGVPLERCIASTLARLVAGHDIVAVPFVRVQMVESVHVIDPREGVLGIDNARGSYPSAFRFRLGPNFVRRADIPDCPRHWDTDRLEFDIR